MKIFSSLSLAFLCLMNISVQAATFNQVEEEELFLASLCEDNETCDVQECQFPQTCCKTECPQFRKRKRCGYACCTSMLGPLGLGLLVGGTGSSLGNQPGTNVDIVLPSIDIPEIIPIVDIEIDIDVEVDLDICNKNCIKVCQCCQSCLCCDECDACNTCENPTIATGEATEKTQERSLEILFSCIAEFESFTECTIKPFFLTPTGERYEGAALPFMSKGSLQQNFELSLDSSGAYIVGYIFNFTTFTGLKEFVTFDTVSYGDEKIELSQIDEETLNRFASGETIEWFREVVVTI